MKTDIPTYLSPTNGPVHRRSSSLELDSFSAVMFDLLFTALLNYYSIPAAFSEDNIPECGIRYAVNRHKPVISHGFEAEYLEYPWHVALYRQYSPDQEPEYICGGSIINRDIIVTAAHCVYNESTFSVDNTKFNVVAGKYYRFWNYRHPIEQRFEVTATRVPTTYLGLPNRYADDVAVLALSDSIKFSSTVMPVCIDWSSEFYSNKSKIPGTVVGWGYTQYGNLSNELMVAKLNYFNFTSCRERVDSGFSSFVTSDKFCAGVDNGTAVEQGDSGGGFVVPRNVTGDIVRYYLYGIVSTKDTWTNQTAAFTDLNIHLSWINSTIESLKKTDFCTVSSSSSIELTNRNNNGTVVGCNEPSRRGTKAHIRCKDSFHEGVPYRLLAETECTENRTWSPMTDSCIACGKRFKGLTQDLKKNPEPWHVHIYIGSKFKLICGGTLFHPKAVLTAAHCVHDQKNVTFHASIGKRQCSWKHPENREQIFKVSKIFIKSSYVGVALYYMDDIAILELNDTVKLNVFVMPPCIDWSGKLQLYRNPLISGLTMGCGDYTQPGYKDSLRVNKLRILDQKQCKIYGSFTLTADKICATTDDGSTDLEKGYSGGSFTFPKYNEDTGEEISYLYGIVSHATDGTVRFTDVAYHLEWIMDILMSNITIV